MSDVTRILLQIESGDPAAAEKLLPLVYDELRKLAAAKLAKEKPGQTLQAPALVHEVYLRLVGSRQGAVCLEPCAQGANPEKIPGPQSPALAFSSRNHFFGAAAEAMRRILVESARSKASRKRGGHWQRQPLKHVAVEVGFDRRGWIRLREIAHYG